MARRSFTIGSKWLYYKIYSGPKASDAILTEVILPMAKEFKNKNLIQKWFFIRYADPKHHLRVRFLVSDTSANSKIIAQLFEVLNPLVDLDIVWKIQLDTYHRELERYGENTIELSESIFHYDSLASAHFIDLIEGDEGERLRWLFGLRAIDNLLNIFNYTLEHKKQLLEGLKIRFGEEFGISRPLKKQLDSKYRKERASITNFMNFKEHSEYEPILVILNQTHQKSKPVALQILEMESKKLLQISKNSLLASYIHMLMNRLFKSKNRLNEMVCYDFLFRYYKSKSALSRIEQSISKEKSTT